MMYRFAFDRTKLLMMVGGIVLVGILLFAAGVFTGLALSAPTKSEVAMLKSRHAESSQPAAAAPQPAAPAPAATPAPAPPSAAPAPAVESAAQKPAGAAPKAAVSPADALGAEQSPDQDIYSIQVGSFPDAKAARALQTDLRERGYPASIYTGIDSDHKEWHAVRIGGFPTLNRASTAASIFTSKERMQALVRRSNAP